MQCVVDFTRAERALYDDLRQQAIVSIDEALEKGLGPSKTGVYINALQQIESLRLACNLGLHYHAIRRGGVPQASQNAENWAKVAQEVFNVESQMGPLICSYCSLMVDITDKSLLDVNSARQNSQFFSCLIFICTECITRSGLSSSCGHRPCCPVALVSTNSSDIEPSSYNDQPQTKNIPFRLPSKVEALLMDIKTLAPNQKWYLPPNQGYKIRR